VRIHIQNPTIAEWTGEYFAMGNLLRRKRSGHPSFVEESLDRVRQAYVRGSKQGYLSYVTTSLHDNVPQAYADGAIGKWNDQLESVDFTVDILKHYHRPFSVRLLACSDFTMPITFFHVPRLFCL